MGASVLISGNSESEAWRSFDHLVSTLTAAGSEQVIVKPLAGNQDNEKNQIFLGTEDSLLTMLPGRLTFLSESRSTRKRHSSPGIGKEALALRFSWLFPDGTEELAPRTKLIYYLQYPELRLSGFLHGTSRAPDAVRRDKMDTFRRRVLLLAVRSNDVLGVVVTDRDSSLLVDKLCALKPIPGQTVLRRLALPSSPSSPDLDRLIDEIRAVSSDWHEACVLKSQSAGPVPRQAQQGSGWTLEALLGIPMNGTKGPDKYGYEIKVLPRSGPVSLITSEPDFGWRKERGLTDYLHEFGWPGTKGDGSYRFNGNTTHRDHTTAVTPWSSSTTGTRSPTVLTALVSPMSCSSTPAPTR